MEQVDIINKLLRHQMDLNNKVAGKGWEKGIASNGRKTHWKLAILGEATELIESLNWKHWKDVQMPHDMDNARIEAIDLIHFTLSLFIEDEHFGTDKEGSALIDKITLEEPLTINEIPDIIDTDEIYEIYYAIASNIDSPPKSLLMLSFQMAHALCMTDKDIYAAYLIKNALNAVRSTNGYKESEYYKIWDHQEDNHYLLNNLSVDEDDDIESLTIKIQEVYDSLGEEGLLEKEK